MTQTLGQRAAMPAQHPRTPHKLWIQLSKVRPVCSLLEARRMLLLDVERHRWSESQLPNPETYGLVKDAEDRIIARISYSGQAWEPGPVGVQTTEISMSGR